MRKKSAAAALRSLKLGGRQAWQLYQAVHALRAAADEVHDAGDELLAEQLRANARRLDQRRMRLMRLHGNGAFTANG